MRDLTKIERDFYSIFAAQIEDERPMRIMCPLADKFLKLFRAYEKKCEEIKNGRDF